MDQNCVGVAKLCHSTAKREEGKVPEHITKMLQLAATTLRYQHKRLDELDTYLLRESDLHKATFEQWQQERFEWSLLAEEVSRFLEGSLQGDCRDAIHSIGQIISKQVPVSQQTL